MIEIELNTWKTNYSKKSLLAALHVDTLCFDIYKYWDYTLTPIGIHWDFSASNINNCRKKSVRSSIPVANHFRYLYIYRNWIYGALLRFWFSYTRLSNRLASRKSVSSAENLWSACAEKSQQRRWWTVNAATAPTILYWWVKYISSTMRYWVITATQLNWMRCRTCSQQFVMPKLKRTYADSLNLE